MNKDMLALVVEAECWWKKLSKTKKTGVYLLIDRIMDIPTSARGGKK